MGINEDSINLTDINIELCDCNGILNLKIREEKNKYIVQGNDFCKVYDKLKGLDFKIDKNIVKASFNSENLTRLVVNDKFKNLLINARQYCLQKYNKTNWKNLFNVCEVISDTIKIKIAEKNIKNKKFCVYPENSYILNSEKFCICDKKNISVLNYKNNIKYKNSIGGIIFDSSDKFINYFDTRDKLKNIIISDINHHSIWDRMKDDLNMLSGLRLILKYPTNNTINKIRSLIRCGLHAPKSVWIIVSSKIIINGTINFYDVVNILLWNDMDNVFQNNIQVVGFICESTQKNDANEKNLNIENIKYTLNDVEILLSNNKISTLEYLDNIYIGNFLGIVPIKIFDSDLCPICSVELKTLNDENNIKSYSSCGHMYCNQCIVQTMLTTGTCAICRKKINLVDVYIPNLLSSKAKNLIKLISKILLKYKDKKIIIYVDSMMIANRIIKFINHMINAKVLLLKNKTMSQDTNIFVSDINNGFLSQNIKEIKNIILFTNDEITPEIYGYDYTCMGEKINIWKFHSVQ